MGGPRAARLQVGSAPWIAEERSSALQIAQNEVDEFAFSARNEFDWLNEHMSDIFSENHINVAEVFKTPGKLRGKTPRTIRKNNPGENRVPLSDIFSATPKGAANPFAIPNLDRANGFTPKVKVAVDPQPQSSPFTYTAAAPRTTRPALASPEKPTQPQRIVSVVDSGYHGSQSQDPMDLDNEDPHIYDETTQPFSPVPEQQEQDEQQQQQHERQVRVAFHESPQRPAAQSPVAESPETTAHTPGDDVSTQHFTAHAGAVRSPSKQAETAESTTPAGSPLPQAPTSPIKSSPEKQPEPFSEAPTEPEAEVASERPDEPEHDAMDEDLDEPSGSPSDGSSPIRPIVRKSSLNFASLPAREPITHKSNGNRVSRVSHLEQHRTSYYSRPTGGKSLGQAHHDLSDEDDEEENDDMDVDNDEMDDEEDDLQTPQKPKELAEPNTATAHNKTYTQRLQDQISKLGQSQANAPLAPKLAANASAQAASLPVAQSFQAPAQPKSSPVKPSSSPKKPTTPGAFPEDDDEDDWIQTLGTPDGASAAFSPRPGMPKSYSADVMEGLTGQTIGGDDFSVPKTRQESGSKSPERPTVPPKAPNGLGHHKSESVPVLPQPTSEEPWSALKKTVSASHHPLETVSETECPGTPKSPSRNLRDSPLKQVKNKLSSILKSSKGLLASSAAISAEGKSSLLSPSTTRLGLMSTESLHRTLSKDSQVTYPQLPRKASDNETLASTASPAKPEGRRTRASIEKEKAEEKRKKEEEKETRRQAEQMEKLEKAREKEREKARVFSKEQERLAAMEKQVTSQKAQEKKLPAPPAAQPAKTTRSSPRKKPQPEPESEPEPQAANAGSDDQAAGDVDMADATTVMPPPSIPRPAPASANKPREIKRPVRPAKEPVSKAKQAPTVIRVNMGSQQSQFHPTNSTLSSNLQDTLGSSTAQPSQAKGKGKEPALQPKASLQSLKNSTSTSRPKALEMAARKKEQEEREAQRKRDAKAELDRKRAAQEEERRQEQQRRLDAQRQREDEQQKQAEAKKTAQRQAMIEKAKQTRAPPPAVRNQPNGPPDFSATQQSQQPPRPASRMNMTAPKSQEDLGRPTTAYSNASKASMKRPLQNDHADDSATRQPTRPGTSHAAKDTKRMRMTDEFDEEPRMAGKPSLKGAPVRPSGGMKKDIPNKAMFPAGYANAPPSATRDLFKSTVTNQHNSHAKAGHPLDTAQFSKGAIPFAPSGNQAGPSSHKTPARPAGGAAAAKSTVKSAQRSSPRFQNGESIELPEIDTDEDSDDDDGKGMVAAWADSPALRKALADQESIDPFSVFGAPGPLNMEELFPKSKERFHKFRARTSSANWSGHDKLTEDDIRKDLVARERMRREGGWTYEMSRDMA